MLLNRKQKLKNIYLHRAQRSSNLTDNTTLSTFVQLGSSVSTAWFKSKTKEQNVDSRPKQNIKVAFVKPRSVLTLLGLGGGL